MYANFNAQAVSVDLLRCNASKVGVDAVDQMACKHTCKSATRRWTVAVFLDIIECAYLNAYIIYSEVTGQSLKRRELLF